AAAHRAPGCRRPPAGIPQLVDELQGRRHRLLPIERRGAAGPRPGSPSWWTSSRGPATGCCPSSTGVPGCRRPPAMIRARQYRGVSATSTGIE
ncbi:hypothetical protein ACV1CY_20615, partial [Aeromonas caviae]